MKEFDAAELGQYNGENGNPVYIAHGGKVYDVSGSKMWRNGSHMKRHKAGRDLTTDIQAAPHDTAVLDRYPQVGKLKKAVDERPIPAALQWLLKRYPFLRRHPHPMTVHFPIVFMFSTTVFNVLYLLTGLKAFETTAFHCLGAGVLFNMVGIVTGLYTWWLNYMAKMLKPVRIKLPLTLIMLLISILLFIWRATVPEVMDNLQGVNLLYFMLVLSLAGIVTVVGWNGAAMTFPVEHE
jgi:predicted heme/steroid binding protein/uncharacterized membrane protein